MKKIGIGIIILLLIFVVGCNTTVKTEGNNINLDEELTLKVAGLKGPTSMGMIKLFDEYTNPYENLTIEYFAESAPDLLVGKLIKGELDFAAVPVNLASIIYNKTEGKYKFTNINTLNVTYLVTNGVEINSLDDLKGKTIYVSGQGATPDYVTRYLLQKNNLKVDEDVFLDFSLDHASLAQAVIAGDVDIAVLPQPFITTVTMKNENVKIAIDLLDEWNKVSGDSILALGGLIVKTELAENHPDIVNEFLLNYEKSVNYVNENVVEASQLVEKHGILPAAKIAELAIPLSNIVYMDAYDNSEGLNEYLKILMEFNPQSIGGKLPDENFYYKK